MDSSAPIEIASTIQSASIRHHPDPDYDINPSTSASKVEPVDLSSSTVPAAEDEVPLSALRPHPRRKTLPPLPDLRFEQSYLKSIEGALSWQGVAWITVRDQVRDSSLDCNEKSMALFSCRQYAKLITYCTAVGLTTSIPRHIMDTRNCRLAALEPRDAFPGCQRWSEDPALVVGREQMANTGTEARSAYADQADGGRSY